MEQAQFDAMVQRLEVESAVAPRRYLLKVALLAALGFLILALIVGIAVSGLVLLVVVALAMLFKGGALWLWLLKLGKLGLLLAIPMWLLVKTCVQALFVRIPAPQGREITRADAPALFTALDDMRRRLRGPRFHNVLVVDELNAAVLQRPAFGLFGWPRNYLMLGLPLLEGLRSDEAMAVVAHEYGHLAGSHSRFAAFIYRLRNTWGTIQDMAAAWQGWGGRLLGRLVSWYAPYFNAYTFVLARSNEYEADAASAELVGAPSVASALKRFHITHAQHASFIASTFGTLREQAAPPRDLAQQWAARAPMPPAREEALDALQQALDRAPDPLDTHPTLRHRLQALAPGDAALLPVPPQAMNGPSAANAWFGPLAERLRNEQQQQWASGVEQAWGERHEHWQQRRARLAELAALPAPDAAQQFELLRLRIEFDPQHDHLPALAAFNAAHIDHVSGLFIEGSQRLNAGDAQGLVPLERAMELDSDAIKPGCERAYNFLTERNDERAQHYQKRWLERDRWERERQHQIDTLLPEDALMAADLDAGPMALVQQRTQALGSDIAHAWIARRLIAADSNALCFVLGVEATLWARLRRKDKALIQTLAQQQWPMELHVCLLSEQYKPLRAKFEQLPGAQLR